jgi:hypothetical protein
LPQFIPSLGSTLGELKPKDVTVAILGNHDHENDAQAIVRVLEQSGVVHLDNEVYTLRRGHAILHIAGVDDVAMGKDRLDLVLEKLPRGGAAVLLAHEPDFAQSSAMTKRFDLQLSGHSHGGQVRLPFLKPPILPPWGKSYYSGFYQVGDTQLYTNSGLGMTGLCLRFFARPEITVFTLVAPGVD